MKLKRVKILRQKDDEKAKNSQWIDPANPVASQVSEGVQDSYFKRLHINYFNCQAKNIYRVSTS